MSMHFNPSVCPVCGEPVYATSETVPGAALLHANDDGTFEYSGETVIFWDDQKTDNAGKDRVWVRCSDGHEWRAVLKDE